MNPFGSGNLPILRIFLRDWECRTPSTPVEVGSTLQPATNEVKPVNQTEYQSAIGNLMHLLVSSRPDITFVVNNLAQFNSNPQKEHWTTLK